MTGNIKPRYFASRSLDVAIVGDDDGLDERAQARPSPDDAGHIQCLSCRHDACLEQLQARMGDGRDFLLENAPLHHGRFGRASLLEHQKNNFDIC